MIEPLQILLYCFIVAAGLTALWYALVWIRVPSPLDRIIMLVAAILILWWILQKFGVM